MHGHGSSGRNLKNPPDSQTLKNFPGFFKEEVRYFGVKLPMVVKIKKQLEKVRAFIRQSVAAVHAIERESRFMGDAQKN